MGKCNARENAVMNTVFTICLVLLVVSLFVSLYFNYKHGILIIRLIDEIEQSLDIMDEKENSISQILEIPLFYDSPQIRQVHTDISACRDSILKVATALGSIDDTDEAEA